MTRRLRFALLLLILAAYAWRVQGLTNQSLWRDEVDAIYFATRHLPDTLSMFVRAGQNGPLFFLALRPWFTLAGTSEFALRYVPVLAGTLTAPLLWQVARRLTPGKTVPLLAAAFLALNPYQLWYSQEGKMYTVITALVLLATLFFWEGVTRGGWRPWLGYLLTVTVALYTHLLLILLYPLHFLWFLIAWPQSRRHWKGYALALAGLILPYAPMVWWQWDLLTADRQMTGFAFTPLTSTARAASQPRPRLHAARSHCCGWGQSSFWAAGMVLGGGEDRGAARRRRTAAPARRWLLAAAVAALSWLLAPILSIYLLSLRQPILRTATWCGSRLHGHDLPGPGRTGDTALCRLLRPLLRRHRRGVGGLRAGLLALWRLAADAAYEVRPAQRGCLRHDAATPGSLLILQIPHLEYAMRYYNSGDFGPRPFEDEVTRLAPGPAGCQTNNGWPDDQARQLADQQMRDITAGIGDVWVLRSEVEMWDQRRASAGMAGKPRRDTDQADFHGVQVRRYLLSPAAQAVWLASGAEHKPRSVDYYGSVEHIERPCGETAERQEEP